MLPFNRRHQLIGKISLLALMMALFGGLIPAQAGLTVPLMVDYLDTGGFGASSLTGVAFISTTGNFAVLDDQADKVFITDPNGNLQSEISTGSLISDSASGIAFIPSSGEFAIVDNGVKRVFIIDAAGNVQAQFETTSFGSNDPQGITYMTSGLFVGNLAVLDNQTKTVFVVDFSGNLQAFFSAPGNFLTGITFIPETGNFAIVDNDSDEVRIVNTVGVVQDVFKVGFVSTNNRGITFNSMTGNLVVASDNEDEIFSFNVKGQVFDTFSTSDFGSTLPAGITYIPPTKNFAIVDPNQSQVFFVEPDGTQVSQCDISGFANFAAGITYISGTGNLTVVDDDQDQVFIFDSDCNPLDQFDIGTFGINTRDAKGITSVPGGLSATGQFQIVDTGTGSVKRIDPALPGKIQSQFSANAFGISNPEGIALIGNTENFAIVDNAADAVFIIGSQGDLRGKFDISEFSSAPHGIAFDSDNNRIAVVDSDSQQAIIFDLPALVTPPLNRSCKFDADRDGDVDGEDLFLCSEDKIGDVTGVALQRFAEEFGNTDCN